VKVTRSLVPFGTRVVIIDTMEQRRNKIGVGPANDAMVRAVQTFGKTKGLNSVKDLAEASGIPLGTLKPRMAGNRGLDVEQIFALAPVLGLTAAELVEFAEGIYRKTQGIPTERTPFNMEAAEFALEQIKDRADRAREKRLAQRTKDQESE
jgi:transcriptional regulator with XRE-family HTH domain